MFLEEQYIYTYPYIFVFSRRVHISIFYAALFPVVHVSTDAREIRAREDRSNALDRFVTMMRMMMVVVVVIHSLILSRNNLQQAPHLVKTRLSKKKLFGNFVDAIL